MRTQARKYKSDILSRMLKRISPLQQKKVDSRMTLAANIHDLMEEKDWSKTQFALKVNKNASVITKWLSGQHNFTDETLVEIAFAFNIEVHELYAYHLEQSAQNSIFHYFSLYAVQTLDKKHSVNNQYPSIAVSFENLKCQDQN